MARVFGSTLGLVAFLTPFLATAQQTAQDTAATRQAAPAMTEIRKVSDLIGADVYGQANESIATLRDLILTPEGVPQYAILSRGGVAGIGATYFAAPWEALNVRFADGKWGLGLPTMTKQSLEQVPTFQYDHYRDLTDAAWIDRVLAFFRTPTTRTDPAPAEPREGATAGQAPSNRGPVSIVLRASKIIGTNLKNARDESLGEVKDLLMDRNDRVAFAIVGRGGVLNIGERYVPVPWEKLRMTVNRSDTAVGGTIDATKDQLEKAPLVDGTSYATLLGAGFIDQVDRYFGVTRSDGSRRREGPATPPAGRP